MQIDTKYLRQQYSMLSDEALLAVNRADLVDAAQKCYDDELEQRDLVRGNRRHQAKSDAQSESEPLDTEDQADWLVEAAEVYSRIDLPGSRAEDVVNVRDVLQAAGIPCTVEMEQIPPEPERQVDPPPMQRWRVLVPGNLNLQATSILDRDIFNDEFEAQWKAHLEVLSDDDVQSMTPQTVFCGLFDRIERVIKVYDEELAHRGL